MLDIKKIREKSGLKRKEMAFIIGVSDFDIYLWEEEKLAEKNINHRIFTNKIAKKFKRFKKVIDSINKFHRGELSAIHLYNFMVIPQTRLGEMRPMDFLDSEQNTNTLIYFIKKNIINLIS
jgi:DNA-binding XRE family transcriptional regulator